MRYLQVPVSFLVLVLILTPTGVLLSEDLPRINEIMAVTRTVLMTKTVTRRTGSKSTMPVRAR